MSLSPTPWTLDMDAIDRGVDVLAADGGSVCNCFANDANLIAAAPTGLAVAESTYLALLKMSHDSLWRTFNQRVYCDLRDFIADATGRDGEEVQNEFEARAMGGL